MVKVTHMAIGAAAFTAVTKGIDPAGIALAAMAACLPDLDLILPGFHRTFTHTIWAVAGIFFLTQAFFPGIAYPVTIGYFSHIAIDALTPMGIKPLYPLPPRIALPITVTGSILDRVVLRWVSLIYIGSIFWGQF